MVQYVNVEFVWSPQWNDVKPSMLIVVISSHLSGWYWVRHPGCLPCIWLVRTSNHIGLRIWRVSGSMNNKDLFCRFPPPQKKKEEYPLQPLPNLSMLLQWQSKFRYPRSPISHQFLYIFWKILLNMSWINITGR